MSKIQSKTDPHVHIKRTLRSRSVHGTKKFHSGDFNADNHESTRNKIQHPTKNQANSCPTPHPSVIKTEFKLKKFVLTRGSRDWTRKNDLPGDSDAVALGNPSSILLFLLRSFPFSSPWILLFTLLLNGEEWTLNSIWKESSYFFCLQLLAQSVISLLWELLCLFRVVVERLRVDSVMRVFERYVRGDGYILLWIQNWILLWRFVAGWS